MAPTIGPAAANGASSGTANAPIPANHPKAPPAIAPIPIPVAAPSGALVLSRAQDPSSRSSPERAPKSRTPKAIEPERVDGFLELRTIENIRKPRYSSCDVGQTKVRVKNLSKGGLESRQGGNELRVYMALIWIRGRSTFSLLTDNRKLQYTITDCNMTLGEDPSLPPGSRRRAARSRPRHDPAGGRPRRQERARKTISQSYLSQLESGARPHLTNATRMLLAQFFKVHPGYLVDDPEGFHRTDFRPRRPRRQARPVADRRRGALPQRPEVREALLGWRNTTIRAAA